MKNLRISELVLWSDRERRARRVPFHPQTTVVLGGNDTGKSSLLKSIYWTFGAEPYTVHDDWRTADVASVVKFTIDERAFSILKRGSVYAVFDGNSRLLKTFTRVTDGLGPFLAGLVAFRLRLASRQNEIITPPPAYFFLPYYIDQDGGWTDNWSSFTRLNQIPQWRSSVVEYHTGIKPNEYYEARAALHVAEEELRRQLEETAILEHVRDRMQQETHTAQFDVSLEDFRDQLEELLKRCGALLAIEESLKNEMQDLSNTAHMLDNQRRIVEAARHEVGKDYVFATKKLVDDTIDCPICGATYANSFADRFLLAKDEDRLTVMLFELDEERRENDERLKRTRARFDDNREEVEAVRALLETTRSEISLAMVLQSQGRKEVDAIFLSQLKEARERQATLDDQTEGHRTRAKQFDDRDRKKEIVAFYGAAMRSHTHTLNCERLGESVYRRIDTKIKESGSDQPRALLAYFFSVLQTMRKHSTSTFCPIVIDSPNQQAQDDLNLPGMLKFIRQNVPAEAQLILALEDLHGVDFGGDTIVLDQRNRVMLDREYDAVKDEMGPLLERALSNDDEPGRLPFDKK